MMQVYEALDSVAERGITWTDTVRLDLAFPLPLHSFRWKAPARRANRAKLDRLLKPYDMAGLGQDDPGSTFFSFGLR